MFLSLSSNYIYYMTLRGRITDMQEYNAPGTVPDQRLWIWRMAPGHTQGTVHLKVRGEGYVLEFSGYQRPGIVGSCSAWCPCWVVCLLGARCCSFSLRIWEAKWTRANGWGWCRHLQGALALHAARQKDCLFASWSQWFSRSQIPFIVEDTVSIFTCVLVKLLAGPMSS